MKIEYLRLENFALVKSGMGLNKIELDFHKAKNVINLIVGNNGTGKTGGILSNLHPYAGLGHLEAREDTNIIIPGKKGLKVITFKDKKATYEIEHHYVWQGEKRSRKISSYCKKNGVELNPTGNVSSFNQVIEREMGIDINFLKLIRLGPNVKNFIDHSATDRKAFISRLMKALEVYQTYQKIISEKNTLLNNALKIAVDKLHRLDVKDITQLKDSIAQKEQRIQELQDRKENMIRDFAAYTADIDTSKFSELDELESSIKDQLADLDYEKNHLEKPKFPHIVLDNSAPLPLYIEQLGALNNQKIDLVSQRAKCLAEQGMVESQLDELRPTLESGLKEDGEELDLNERIKELKDRIKYYEKNFDKKDPGIHSMELNEDIDKLHMILFHLKQILDTPSESIECFLNLWKQYDGNLSLIDKNVHKKMRDNIIEIENLKNLPRKKVLEVLYIPQGCKHWKDCPYYQVSQDVQTTEGKRRLSELEDENKCLEYLEVIIPSIHSIKAILKIRNPNITQYTVTLDTILSAILRRDNTFVDMDKIQDLMERVEYYEEYVKNKDALEDSITRLSLIRATSGKVNFQELNDKVNQLSISNVQLKERIDTFDHDIEKIEKKIKLLDEMIGDYQVELNYTTSMDKILQQMDGLKRTMDSIQVQLKKRDSYQQKKKEHDSDLSDLEYRIKAYQEEIYDLKTKERQYIELKKEIADVEEFYNYSDLIKDAVSNRTGIPKIKIKAYCKGLKKIANDIISETYGGELILRDFDITDNDFNIPYYTKGANVSDIRYASQAEKAVATLAISFAILIQFNPKYNILLLDEVDGALESDNQRKLLSSLEGELQVMGCEQIFLITQSKMYNDYPVNLIITDPDYKPSDSAKAKIIFQR